MQLTLIWLISGLLFLFLLISLGFQPRLMNKLLGFLFLFVGVVGLGFYGYGYFCLHEDGLLAAAKTVFWVFCMFLGRNDIGTISKVPLLSTTPFQILIYFTHLLALYATASTVVTNVGARLIRSLNLLLLHHKKIDLIYGVSESALSFAAQLEKQEKNAVVFVDDGGGSRLNERILKMGGILMSDESAKRPTASFLKKIGMRKGRKTLHLYCISEDPAANLRYAAELKTALKERGILPEQCAVSLLVQDEAEGAALQNDGAGGGYGSVLALEREDLLARLMIREYPPCSTVRFDRKGRAAEDFEAVIVGFGQTGQAVLRNLVRNAQFTGSRFHAMIIAKDYSSQAGHFEALFPALPEQYQLDFKEDDARSLAVFDYLKKSVRELNYIAVCTGDDKENAEIAGQYRDFLKEYGSRALIVQCDRSAVTGTSEDDRKPRRTSLYAPGILNGSRLDRRAALINHQYHLKEGRSAGEDWAACDYFSRQSCRAAADYIPAFLKAAGLSEEALKASGWPEDKVLLENLGEMEHLRWCAFLFSMGYRPMPEEVFCERAEICRKETAAGGPAPLRAGKDTENKLHACLIPWAELPALAEKEKELTGCSTDYRQTDLDNVRLIPLILQEG